MNPVEILYCWQTLLMASVIVGLTQSFKAGIEAILTFRNQQATQQKQSGKEATNQALAVVLSGKELRAQVKMLDSVLLPLFPLVMGSFIGAFVPLRPDVLVQYVAQHAPGSHSAYALWGAAVGQFADYIFQRAKRMFTAATPGNSSRGSNPPSDPPPSDPPSDPVVPDTSTPAAIEPPTK